MKLGLNVKFICFTVFIIVFISLVFSVVFIYQSRKALLNEFTYRARSLVHNLALNVELPLLIENTSQLEALAYNLLSEKDVQSVSIMNQADEVLTAIDKGRTLLPWQIENIQVPVYFTAENETETTEDMRLFFAAQPDQGQEHPPQSGQLIGNIEVIFSRESIIKTLTLMRWWILIAATLATIIGGIAGLYFSRTLILPIQRLAQATYSIARGNWEERLDIVRTDELGQLTESFNIMAESLVAEKQKLETTYKELGQQEKMAGIGKFSMIIAHELKNPLGIIKGSVDILSKQSTAPDIRQTMITYIQDEVKRLNRLIDDFLSFARPAPPQKTRSSINAVVQKTAEHFLIPKEYNKKITLHAELAPTPPLDIDENQLYHALLNLLNNAVHAIEHSGHIYLTTAFSGGVVTITVRDTGTGISEEMRAKVFEPFFTTKAKGTGLGLAIVNKIVKNHDGRIEVSDAGDAGTCFTIQLPAPARPEAGQGETKT